MKLKQYIDIILKMCDVPDLKVEIAEGDYISYDTIYTRFSWNDYKWEDYIDKKYLDKKYIIELKKIIEEIINKTGYNIKLNNPKLE